jgi:phosphinothricin acetyltransferase
MIRPVAAADAAAIADIYNHYVEHTVITFEEDVVSRHEMARRIVEITAKLPWLVAELGGAVIGYAYAGAWRPRSAYRFAVESTVYLAPDATRKGLGLALYSQLIDELRARKLHCVMGGITLPNEASVGLHEKLGFRKVGHLEQVGWKQDRWLDVGYWQLLL